ncbi:hypothetical protein Tco_1078512 [Tanacetum coccineum]|uniref:Uncharacterized protein n=1 Tax=Tanacetum coccineum TaxID=301880 RepID=A0ABQ5HQT9_9ASTR
MGEPLSPDRVFDFPMDKPEPHFAYDFFAPGLLPGYIGNPNNNGWIEADVTLIGELGAEVDKQMIYLVIDEVAEPIAEGEEHVIASVIDVEEDIAMLFDDDNLVMMILRDSRMMRRSRSTYEVGGPSTVAEGHSLALPTPRFHVPPLVIEDLSTRMGNLEYGHRQLVKKVIQVSDAEVADGITIGEIGPRVSVVEGRIEPAGADFVGRWAAERCVDSTASDYGF